LRKIWTYKDFEIAVDSVKNLGDFVGYPFFFILSIAKIEGDFVKKPGVQMIFKIANVLGVSVEDLIK
jgi:adenylate cyclase class IV